MQDSKQPHVRVAADGTGLVSRAGVALLRELTVTTGLGTGWSEALLDTYAGKHSALVRSALFRGGDWW